MAGGEPLHSKELAPLLRPLILAVFLAYTILPAHRALCRRVPARLAGPLLALLVAAVVIGLAVIISPRFHELDDHTDVANSLFGQRYG